MGYIHCCGGLHRTRSFVLHPTDGFRVCEMDYLSSCPVCGNCVVQITRIDFDNQVSTVRYTKKKAEKFWQKSKKKILYEKNENKGYFIGKFKSFYLNYNEYGAVKKCYSNISNLKMGIF